MLDVVKTWDSLEMSHFHSFGSPIIFGEIAGDIVGSSPEVQQNSYFYQTSKTTPIHAISPKKGSSLSDQRFFETDSENPSGGGCQFCNKQLISLPTKNKRYKVDFHELHRSCVVFFQGFKRRQKLA